MLKRHRIFLIFLILFFLSEIAELVIRFFWLPVYESFFLCAIVTIILGIFRQNNFVEISKYLRIPLALIFIFNLIVFLVYIPTIHLNPDINWTLKEGGSEVDPYYLLMYIPLINFIAGISIILLSLSIKFAVHKFYYQ